MKLRNLTQHTINVVKEDGTPIIDFPSEGNARAEQISEAIGVIGDVTIFKTSFGKPIDLPDPEEGVGLIVSAITANSAKEHGRSLDDLYLTFDLVRDPNNKSIILGCKGLAKLV